MSVKPRASLLFGVLQTTLRLSRPHANATSPSRWPKKSSTRPHSFTDVRGEPSKLGRNQLAAAISVVPFRTRTHAYPLPQNVTALTQWTQNEPAPRASFPFVDDERDRRPARCADHASDAVAVGVRPRLNQVPRLRQCRLS